GEVSEGDELTDDILLDVYENEVTGTYQVPVKVKTETGITVDSQTLDVEVLPRQNIRNLNIVESPTFPKLESGDTEEVGFLVENTGDYDLADVSLEVRNADKCIESASGTYNFSKGERKNVKFDIETNSEEGRCTGVFVLNSEEGTELDFTPAQIQIVEGSLINRLTTNLLPIIVVIWTLFTVYWIRRRFYER
ncbi:MAG: hypothetical protein V5A72_03345, partial [Candidatus Nanohaloarchaea archaeon]